MSKRRNPHRHLRLVVAYEGTRYAGWQRQKNLPTIQSCLENAFQKVMGTRVHVTGSGRTDSGVHAQSQVAHVKVRTQLSSHQLHRALNAVLPEDIVIRSLESAPSDFHARFQATLKRYRYTLWNCPIRPVFGREQLLHVPLKLNLAAMRRAAKLLQGRHDFRAFHSSGRQVSSTVRTLRSLRVVRSKELVQIEAEADGFLYHMVRRIVGLLLEVGRGKVRLEMVKELLQGRKGVIPPTAPAKGLCLVKVSYS